VFAAAFITYLDRVCMSVAAPSIQEDLRLSQLEFAWVFTVFNAAYGVFEIPTAWLGEVGPVAHAHPHRRLLVAVHDLHWPARSLAACWSHARRSAPLKPRLPSCRVPWRVGSAARTKPRQRHHVDGRAVRGALAPAAVALLIIAGWRYIFGAVGLWCVVARFGTATIRQPPFVDAEELKSSASARCRSAGRRARPGGTAADPTMIALFCSYFASGFGFQFFVTCCRPTSCANTD
jgi:MFS family permease